MLSEANFLILDEPTNHLDIMSREILETALNHYSGTVLYVSHDRYFINKTAHRILELSELSFTNYLGNYDYYLEKKAPLLTASDGTLTSSASVARDVTASESKQDWKQKKEEQAARRKRENELKKTEARIEEAETRIAEIEAEMLLPEVCTDVGKLQTLQKEKDALDEELLELMEAWEELSED